MGKVVFLGVEGAGKTLLTAALVRYFEAHYGEWGWSLRPENKEAFAFSTRMPMRMNAGELPAQTARFRHLEWSLCYNDNPKRSLSVLDYPGEVYRLAFLDPEDDPDPDGLQAKQKTHAEEIAELLKFLRGAEEVYLLFNIEDSKALEESNVNIDAVWTTVEALRILSALEQKPKLTLLVTQADRLENDGEDVSSAETVLRRHVPLICRRFKQIEMRLVSSLRPESKIYGLISVAKDIVRGTAECKNLNKIYNEYCRRVLEGTATAAELEKLESDAEPFKWMPGVCDGLNECRRWLKTMEACYSIEQGPYSHEVRMSKFQDLLDASHDDVANKIIKKEMDAYCRTRSDNIAIGWFLLCVFTTVAALIIILVACSNK